jgi:hypothetical protein
MSYPHLLRALFSDAFARIRYINAKYAEPRIAMSPAVRFALLSLRIYLLLLVGLLAYKFYAVLAAS